MLVGHSDEIGFQVRYIDDNGFIFFAAVGGVDPQVTQGRRVHIHTGNGVVPGVIGRKPIHLIEAKDRDTIVKLDAQYIDIGSASKEETEQLIRIGDPVTFAESLEKLHGDRITSRGFDDKAGSFVVAEVLRHIASLGEKLPVDLYGFLRTGGSGLKAGEQVPIPLIGLGHMCGSRFQYDQPDLDKKSAGDVKLGGGPILPREPT
jgi:endoglucanase